MWGVNYWSRDSYAGEFPVLNLLTWLSNSSMIVYYWWYFSHCTGWASDLVKNPFKVWQYCICITHDKGSGVNVPRNVHISLYVLSYAFLYPYKCIRRIQIACHRSVYIRSVVLLNIEAGTWPFRVAGFDLIIVGMRTPYTHADGNKEELRWQQSQFITYNKESGIHLQVKKKAGYLASYC